MKYRRVKQSDIYQVGFQSRILSLGSKGELWSWTLRHRLDLGGPRLRRGDSERVRKKCAVAFCVHVKGALGSLSPDPEGWPRGQGNTALHGLSLALRFPRAAVSRGYQWTP